LDNLNLIKFGLYLGKIEDKYFKPAHTFIISLKYEDFKNKISFKSDSDEINRYLRGETLIVNCKDGFYGVFVDGYIVGGAKCIDKTLKNLFPKGWRKQN
jgi:NOL1/NOP2/fmu family ribosome biogenesis protein